MSAAATCSSSSSSSSSSTSTSTRSSTRRSTRTNIRSLAFVLIFDFQIIVLDERRFLTLLYCFCIYGWPFIGRLTGIEELSHADISSASTSTRCITSKLPNLRST